MNIIMLKFRTPTLIAILLVFIIGAHSAWAQSPAEPASGASNSKAGATAHQNAEMIEQAARDFEMAMRRWSQGLFGALIFYHRTDGPLTREFQDIIERDPDLPRIPVFHRTECITCNAAGECEATVTIKFNTESTAPKLIKYLLRNTGNWSPYSETTLAVSPGLRESLQACKARLKNILALSKDKNFKPTVDDSKGRGAVRLAFEKTMRAYRDEKWNDLLPLLAPYSRHTILKQLAKPGGEQELLKTGEVPETWKFDCAVRALSDSYHVYARMANRNHNGQMQPFRFTFVADPPDSERWLLADLQSLLEQDYFQEHTMCLKR